MISQKMYEKGMYGSRIRNISERADKRKSEIGDENVFDFSLGNPNAGVPEEISNKIIELAKDKNIHSYTNNAGDISVRRSIAESITKKHGCPASYENIFMTCGAASAIVISLNALFEENNSVLAIAPFFPEYRVYSEKAGYFFQYCMTDKGSFQIDETELKKKIDNNTKCIIINSPNNPTGVILTEKSIITLAKVLEEKEKEYGHPIFLISDEPYREIAFDNIFVPFIPNYYKNTIVCYSYSKSLSLPGERIGYIFINPESEKSSDVFYAVKGAALSLGYVCAPSIFQKLVSSVNIKTDITLYQKNRDLLYEKLVSLGFEVVHPDGAFYMFVKSPINDAVKFAESAEEFELFMIPSDDFMCPGYVRIAYCVKTEKIIASFGAWEKLSKLYFGDKNGNKTR